MEKLKMHTYTDIKNQIKIIYLLEWNKNEKYKTEN